MPDAPRRPRVAAALPSGLDGAEPPATLHVTPFVWPAGRPIHRIHLTRFAAAAFNPGARGNAWFSPIIDAHGDPIPTLYGCSVRAGQLVPQTASRELVDGADVMLELLMLADLIGVSVVAGRS